MAFLTPLSQSEIMAFLTPGPDGLSSRIHMWMSQAVTSRGLLPGGLGV